LSIASTKVQAQTDRKDSESGLAEKYTAYMIKVSSMHFPRSLWILFAGVFLNRFGSFVSVFLVLYMTARGYTAAQAGIAPAAYGIGSLAASFCGGYLADWPGRRATIVLSMFSSAATMLALSQAQTLPLIIILAGLAGMTAELYRPAASALIADLVPAEQQVVAFAWYRFAINLGFAVGPTVAGLLASHSFLFIFLGDALTSCAFGLLALFALPGYRHPAMMQECERDGLWRTLRYDYRYLLFLLASALLAFVYFQHLSTFALQVQAYGLSNTIYGLLISVNGICIIFLELPLSSITRRLPTRPVIAFGWLLIAVGFSLIAIAHTLALLILTVIIWTLGEMVHSPVSAAYVANMAPAHLRGRYQGIWGLAWGCGLVLAPLLGSLLFSWSAMGFWLLCGALGLLAALLVLPDGRLPASRNV
jgi:MFS family permease